MAEFRFPVAGSYNTRADQANPFGAASGIVGLGTVGTMIVGSTTGASVKDRRFINCWTETVRDEFNQVRTLYLCKRPGFAALNTPQAGSIGNAVMVWTGQGAGTKVISAFGATNSSIYDGTTQLVTNNGTTTIITGKATAITETSISNTPTLVISSSDNTAWYYQDAGTVTKIADAQFPGNNSLTLAGTFAHMDGYAFIMDTNGSIWNSDLNSVTSWTAAGVIAANSYPDKGVGCIRKGNRIMAFGTETVQFFEQVGNPFGTPLQRIESMTVKVGCVNANAITSMGDSVYWAGSSPEGGLSVYGYTDGIQKVSFPEIDRILVIAGASNISMSSIKIYGRSFILVRALTATYVYCVEEKAWHQWQSTTVLWSRTTAVAAGSTQVSYAISTSGTSGKVYTINPASFTFQDDGVAYAAIAQSALVGSGNKRVFWDEVEFVCDRETSASPMTVAYSDDDYQNTVIMGEVDLSAARPRLTQCGSAYRRSWILSHSANTPFRIEAMIGRKNEGQR